MSNEILNGIFGFFGVILGTITTLIASSFRERGLKKKYLEIVRKDLNRNEKYIKRCLDHINLNKDLDRKKIKDWIERLDAFIFEASMPHIFETKEFYKYMEKYDLIKDLREKKEGDFLTVLKEYEVKFF